MRVKYFYPKVKALWQKKAENGGASAGVQLLHFVNFSKCKRRVIESLQKVDDAFEPPTETGSEHSHASTVVPPRFSN